MVSTKRQIPPRHLSRRKPLPIQDWSCFMRLIALFFLVLLTTGLAACDSVTAPVDMHRGR